MVCLTVIFSELDGKGNQEGASVQAWCFLMVDFVN